MGMGVAGCCENGEKGELGGDEEREADERKGRWRRMMLRGCRWERGGRSWFHVEWGEGRGSALRGGGWRRVLWGW